MLKLFSTSEEAWIVNNKMFLALSPKDLTQQIKNTSKGSPSHINNKSQSAGHILYKIYKTVLK